MIDTITNYFNTMFKELNINNKIVKIIAIVVLAYIIAQIINMFNIHINYTF